MKSQKPVSGTPFRTATLAGVAILLAACAGPREHYVLQPAADGSTGTMRITTADGKPFTLDAKQTAASGGGGKIEPATLDADARRKMFEKAIEAQPVPPARYVLYFDQGGDNLTAESRQQITAVLDEIKRRPAPDLIVVGHTDRVGAVENNDRLALRRADAIRKMLMDTGIAAENIQSAGRGEREPLVPTADEVAEPRNRRVEILVR